MKGFLVAVFLFIIFAPLPAGAGASKEAESSKERGVYIAERGLLKRSVYAL